MYDTILSHLDHVFTGNMIQMESIPCEHLSTESCKMLRLYIGRNPEKTHYGKMKGVFAYKDGRIFEFTWHIHEPKQKFAHLSNQMTEIQEIIKVHNEKYDYDYIDHRHVNFGTKAFWLYTSTNTLSDDDYDLRILMQTIKKWAVKEQLCKSFYKTDKQRIAYINKHYS